MEEARTDKDFQKLNENKVELSTRNNKALAKAIKRAQKGDFDKTIDVDAPTMLKLHERWTIRKMFSIDKGEEYFKLYKETFYINNPNNHYYEKVEDVVMRRISAQHEQGNKDWAKAVSEYLGAEIVE